MTDNARLLFAAARGARIEIRYPDEQVWRRNYFVKLEHVPGHDEEERIHPADEHLQYGPVSSQLREAAEKPPAFLGDVGEPAAAHIWDLWDEGPIRRYEPVDELHKAIFLLLFSEFLADSGI